VVNPDDVTIQYGADALRCFEMFMGPLEDMKPWQTRGIVGISRFFEKIWKLPVKISDQELANNKINNLIHKTIKKISADIEAMHYNTAISQLMILVNALEKEKDILRTHFESFLLLLAPFAPHISEELWEKLGHNESIFREKWPEADEKYLVDMETNLVIQVDGKIRDTIKVSADISEEEVKKIALESEKIKKYLEEKDIKKIIFIKGKLLNIVI
jgi:leucyl-tRNA synthetase